MARFLVVQDNMNCLVLRGDPFIEGSTGNKAIDSVLPLHMIGLVKRVRAWEEPDFILQKINKFTRREVSGGYVVGYKYHQPTITKVQNNA